MINKICGVPFYEISLLQYGLDKSKIIAFPCCPSWLKPPYKDEGYIKVKEDKNNNIDILGTWNSDQMIEFRKSILDKSFKYCNLDLCPFYKSNSLPELYLLAAPHIIRKDMYLSYPPVITRFCLDYACNLVCPSCRTIRTNEPLDQTYNRFISVLSSGTKVIYFNGNGELFFNKHLLKIIRNFSSEKYPDVKKFEIATNGTLLNKKMWESLSEDFRKKATSILISLDSCTEDTYHHLRQGAVFTKTMDNILFISNLRKEEKINYLSLNFVIQKRNIEELPDFIRFADKIGADSIRLDIINNWIYCGECSSYFDNNLALPKDWKIRYKDLLDETKKLKKSAKVMVFSNII